MKNKKFIINDRPIGENFPPYIIAEMSANHNGDIEAAFNIIDQAKKSGADSVKIQTYTADTLTLNSKEKDFCIDDGLWAGKTLYELYEWAHTPWDWHKPLFDYAKKVGITIFSSPFDTTAIDLLEDLNTPAYKIASFEATDLELIKYAASTKKPLIISTGMANKSEIEEAVEAARDSGCDSLALLHCVSGYPAPQEDYNLNTINDMRNNFGTVIGLSDHTLKNTVAIASIACGSSIIEKHFTLDRNAGGPDDSFSLEPKDLQHLCNATKAAWSAMGSINYEKKSREIGNVKFRRSLYFVKEALAGSMITPDMIRSIRPGFGLPPKYLPLLIGKTLLKDVKEGDRVDDSAVSLNLN